MINCNYKGRLGNSLFQDISKSILSEKFNLKVDGYRTNDYFPLKMNFYTSGTKINNVLKTINDENFSDFLIYENIENGIHLDGYFQIKDFVLEYEKKIRNHFDLEYQTMHKDDVFIHVRMGDIQNMFVWQNIDYFKKALSKIEYRKIYISSDSIYHPVVQSLINEFDMIVFSDSPTATINFAKNFNNLILSQGTFSWWIGFLSRAEKIYFPKGGVVWHGDIFVFDSWIAIDV